MSYRYCGRDFSEDELDLIRNLTTQRNPPLKRTSLSRVLCERIDWRKPNGGLKDMSARVALLRMERDGLIVLPPSQRRSTRVLRPVPSSPETEPPLFPVPDRLDQVRPLRIEPIRSTKEGKLWNAFIGRYHYLGFTPMPGAQIRYFVRSAEGEPLAVLGFGAAAWKTAPRDKFIGWDAECRQRNLPFVVNNARFLILPWVKIKHLASHVLAQVERCLLDDWDRRYALRPALLETFCESPRFAGTCYRAANWIRVGKTQGRGKLDVKNEYALPVKDIWLRPLRRDWKKVLNRRPSPRVANAYPHRL